MTWTHAFPLPCLSARVLSELGLTMAQFVDLCILCGCDYCDSIKYVPLRRVVCRVLFFRSPTLRPLTPLTARRPLATRGIGPKTALKLIKEHGSLEIILARLDKTKYPIPEAFDFEQARTLFNTPEVAPAADVEIKHTSVDEEALTKFLVDSKGFNPDRVARGIEKLKKAKGAPPLSAIPVAVLAYRGRRAPFTAFACCSVGHSTPHGQLLFCDTRRRQAQGQRWCGQRQGNKEARDWRRCWRRRRCWCRLQAPQVNLVLAATHQHVDIRDFSPYVTLRTLEATNKPKHSQRKKVDCGAGCASSITTRHTHHHCRENSTRDTAWCPAASPTILGRLDAVPDLGALPSSGDRSTRTAAPLDGVTDRPDTGDPNNLRAVEPEDADDGPVDGVRDEEPAAAADPTRGGVPLLAARCLRLANHASGLRPAGAPAPAPAPVPELPTLAIVGDLAIRVPVNTARLCSAAAGTADDVPEHDSGSGDVVPTTGGDAVSHSDDAASADGSIAGIGGDCTRGSSSTSADNRTPD